MSEIFNLWILISILTLNLTLMSYVAGFVFELDLFKKIFYGLLTSLIFQILISSFILWVYSTVEFW